MPVFYVCICCVVYAPLQEENQMIQTTPSIPSVPHEAYSKYVIQIQRYHIHAHIYKGIWVVVVGFLWGFFAFSVYTEKLSEKIYNDMYVVFSFLFCIYNEIIWEMDISHTQTTHTDIHTYIICICTTCTHTHKHNPLQKILKVLDNQFS